MVIGAKLAVGGTDAATDEQCIRAAASGDRAAFGELYVRYARLVHGILLARVPPRDAEDLVQDVFMAALRRMNELRTVAAFRGWLAAIARHRAVDYFRERGAAREAVPIYERAGRAGDTPDGLVALNLIRHLPEAYRETMILRLVEGMTGPEIARQTGLTPESVRVNLCRGMKMMRELWGGAGSAGSLAAGNKSDPTGETK
ncbi:MAG TPA: sigma-70 family RNA polymerase sigma factor [Bryobacteraceae bacterium]|nr:sigma-70 family RNA polymerase sigma factor [Bryobacteraceae bacterium]